MYDQDKILKNTLFDRFSTLSNYVLSRCRKKNRLICVDRNNFFNARFAFLYTKIPTVILPFSAQFRFSRSTVNLALRKLTYR